MNIQLQHCFVRRARTEAYQGTVRYSPSTGRARTKRAVGIRGMLGRGKLPAYALQYLSQGLLLSISKDISPSYPKGISRDKFRARGPSCNTKSTRAVLSLVRGTPVEQHHPHTLPATTVRRYEV